MPTTHEPRPPAGMGLELTSQHRPTPRGIRGSRTRRDRLHIGPQAQGSKWRPPRPGPTHQGAHRGSQASVTPPPNGPPTKALTGPRTQCGLPYKGPRPKARSGDPTDQDHPPRRPSWVEDSCDNLTERDHPPRRSLWVEDSSDDPSPKRTTYQSATLLVGRLERRPLTEEDHLPRRGAVGQKTRVTTLTKRDNPPKVPTGPKTQSDNPHETGPPTKGGPGGTAPPGGA